jgi:hypothetical protein
VSSFSGWFVYSEFHRVAFSINGLSNAYMLYIKIFMIFCLVPKKEWLLIFLTILFSKLGFLFVHFILDIGKKWFHRTGFP